MQKISFLISVSRSSLFSPGIERSTLVTQHLSYFLMPKFRGCTGVDGDQGCNSSGNLRWNGRQGQEPPTTHSKGQVLECGFAGRHFPIVPVSHITLALCASLVLTSGLSGDLSLDRHPDTEAGQASRTIEMQALVQACNLVAAPSAASFICNIRGCWHSNAVRSMSRQFQPVFVVG